MSKVDTNRPAPLDRAPRLSESAQPAVAREKPQSKKVRPGGAIDGDRLNTSGKPAAMEAQSIAR